MYESGKGGIVGKRKAEMAGWRLHMPKQLPEEKIRELAKLAVGQSGAKGEKEIGKIDDCLMPQVKGKSDGAMMNKDYARVFEQHQGLTSRQG